MIPPDARDAIFCRDGDWLVPTEFAGGPWSVGAQHGGPVAGLLARSVETCVPPGMRVTRLAVDLLGEVPLEPLRAEVEVVRPGKRIALVRARLLDDAKVLAGATAQLLRTEPIAGIERWLAQDVPHPSRPEEPRGAGWAGLDIPGFARAVDFSWHEETDSRRSIMWTRLRLPLVAGETTSPLVRLASLSDFASGAGNALDLRRFVSINPDLTLHIEREPRSDWIGIEGSTEVRADGTGQSLGSVYDLHGRIARAQASLYVAARG
ncbi:MAG: thioesterase family protein [Deltaproteobacteria bacterium]|nr:thioesterase family protein [Deltaproteobacteria bacterium]MBW2360629.1 thioesterase family protein [Deltaproteobacteria bacterium]